MKCLPPTYRKSGVLGIKNWTRDWILVQTCITRSCLPPIGHLTYRENQVEFKCREFFKDVQMLEQMNLKEKRSIIKKKKSTVLQQ